MTKFYIQPAFINIRAAKRHKDENCKQFFKEIHMIASKTCHFDLIFYLSIKLEFININQLFRFAKAVLLPPVFRDFKGYD